MALVGFTQFPSQCYGLTQPKLQSLVEWIVAPSGGLITWCHSYHEKYLKKYNIIKIQSSKFLTSSVFRSYFEIEILKFDFELYGTANVNRIYLNSNMYNFFFSLHRGNYQEFVDLGVLISWDWNTFDNFYFSFSSFYMIATPGFSIIFQKGCVRSVSIVGRA